ncbi:MAG: hypothetical protein JW749_10915 [Sedimentisphaerales bacterium]|nr:hypothetical protein [Sedimentisphaerales bacterium]
MSAYLNIRISIPEWLDKICAWPLMRYRKLKYGYTFRRIYIDDGKYAIVDEQDYYTYCKYKWILSGYGNNWYAVGSMKIDSKRTKLVALHRLIMNAPKGILVDHQNGNGLDNLRVNLRLATYSQNNINRPKKANTSSKYRGVCFEKSCQEWGVFIRVNGKQKRIGRFKNEIEAARAYDRAALKYHGEFARLNFPREDYINETCPTISK